MTTNSTKTALIVPLCFIFMICAKANTPEPSSALAYQQTTNTRIVVEENHLRFFTGGSERMTIDANGNVGIGTTSSGYNLEIMSNPVSGSERMQKVSIQDAPNDYFEIGNATGSNGQFIPSIRGQHVSDNRMALALSARIESTNDIGDQPLMVFDARRTNGPVSTRNLFSWNNYGQTKMTLSSNGSLGIGTDDPSVKLHVSAGDVGVRTTYSTAILEATDAQLDIISSSAGTWGSSINFIEGNGASNTDVWSIVRQTTNGDGNSSLRFNFGTRNQHTNSAKLIINSNGTVHAQTYTASAPPWPDYVFEDSYELNKLDQVEKYIDENHHLPEIPSAAEVAANGIDIVDMQAKLLQKIEELTLYVIELKKENENQQKQIEELKSNRPSE